MKTNKHTRFLVMSALIAALYAAATYVSAAFGLAFGGIQFRISEMFTVLPLFTPAAVPGLTIGCIIGNLASPYGLADILLGSFATLVSSVCVYFTKNIKFHNVPILAPVFPTVFNGIIVGAEVAFFLPEGISAAAFLISAAQVAFGEAVICFGLGLPFSLFLQKEQFKSLF